MKLSMFMDPAVVMKRSHMAIMTIISSGAGCTIPTAITATITDPLKRSRWGAT